jgi:hypothetical protein
MKQDSKEIESSFKVSTTPTNYAAIGCLIVLVVIVAVRVLKGLWG